MIFQPLFYPVECAFTHISVIFAQILHNFSRINAADVFNSQCAYDMCVYLLCICVIMLIWRKSGIKKLIKNVFPQCVIAQRYQSQLFFQTRSFSTAAICFRIFLFMSNLGDALMWWKCSIDEILRDMRININTHLLFLFMHEAKIWMLPHQRFCISCWNLTPQSKRDQQHSGHFNVRNHN